MKRRVREQFVAGDTREISARRSSIITVRRERSIEGAPERLARRVKRFTVVTFVARGGEASDKG